LKSSNILVTDNGDNVKIIDFGLSDRDYYAMFKQPAGTKRYAAPEQMDANTVVDCRADIYAFGKTLELYLPKYALKKYHNIIKKCTQQDRTKRYNNAGEIRQEIEDNNRKKNRRRLAIILALLMIIL